MTAETTETKDKGDFRWSEGALNLWDWIEDILAKEMRESAKQRAKEKLVTENTDLVTEEDLKKLLPQILKKVTSEVIHEISHKP